MEEESSIKKIFELGNWYHSVAYKNIISKGTFDYTSIVHKMGFPSMENMSVLDVGCSDGFFSKYFIEEKKASHSLGIDFNEYDDTIAFEVLDSYKNDYSEKYQEMNDYQKLESEYKLLNLENSNKFNLLKKVFNLNMEFQNGSIYDLEKFGAYDVTFCGSLLEHLRDPVTAIEQLYNATNKFCIIDISNSLQSIYTRFNLPLIRYTGAGGNFFHHSDNAIKLMMKTIGFKNLSTIKNYKIKIEKYGYYIPHSVVIGFK